MARINLDELRKEEEMRKKDYVWKKPLTLGGRKIQKTINKGEKHG